MTSLANRCTAIFVVCLLLSAGDAVAQNLRLPDDIGIGQKPPTGPITGYADALDRLTLELVTLLKKEKLLVVWLFDESESMQDDQHEIRGRLARVYTELSLFDRKRAKRDADAPLLTAIASFGKTLHLHTRTPTSELRTLQAAVDRIPIDKSGVESTFTAVGQIVQRYRTIAAKSKRKLVVVVATDEAGDDSQSLEACIASAKRIAARVYVLGREAGFGTKFRYVRWLHPQSRRTYWLQSHSGPETALREATAWDGFGGRRSFIGSGFGPYGLVRLCKETNGVYFMLPGAFDGRAKPKYTPATLRKYRPDLRSLVENARDVKRSKLRSTVCNVLRELVPSDERKAPFLVFRQAGFAATPEEFRTQAAAEIAKAKIALALLAKLELQLAGVEELRNDERSLRWRANYDLLRSQLAAHGFRLRQYVLALDAHAVTTPKADAGAVWNVVIVKPTRTPDDSQFARLKKSLELDLDRAGFLKQLGRKQDRANKLLLAVVTEHAGTPWAALAQLESQRGLGVKLVAVKPPPTVKVRPKPPILGPPKL